jgi:UDP-N-acetylglucosamine 2-epimerase (non-hydrolysing)/GDP/UDP-N,N'-diacetylbacillosamine 2-epimerase (hydrolysing)
VIGFTDAFQRLKPDWVVLLGDRYEIFAAAQAAMLTGIPIAHLHGGEATEGLIDEPIRHSITKMAHLHFVAAEPYRRRVIQLGEQPDRVFNFGAPGIETIRRMRLLERAELEHALDFKLDSPFFLVTYHPVTFASIPVTETLDQLFMALEKFPTAHILITKSNADAGGREVNKRLDDFGARNPDRIKVATSLGMLNYLSALRHCDVVIGNSSSGLIEAPSFKKPTVNLGDRQRGRLKAESVIDCEEKTSAIEAAIWKALSPEFRKCCETIVSPYGQGDVALGVKNTLKSFDTAGILMKRFFDFPVGEFK